MFSAYSSYLPSFKNFQNSNTLIILPPKENIKNNKMDIDEEFNNNVKGFILNNSQYQERIKDQLRNTFFSYYHQFEEICTNIMDIKYLKIYEYIYNFCINNNKNKDYLNSLIINTDQNNESFYQGLSKYLKKKNSSSIDTSTIFSPKGDLAFKDIKKLFKDLKIDDLTLELEEKQYQKIRLLIIGELHKIDNISFSLFLSRLMDYQKQEKAQFNYLIIFDSAYDPRFLFDKVKSNFLSKMVFYSIEIDSSQHVYQEILYNVIYSKNLSLFIPNSDNAKLIIDIVNKHQISIMSFKYYFKFLIFQFFLMHNWDDDEYLIFDPLLNGKETEEQISDFFYNKLKQIYGDSNRFSNKDIINLTNLYKNKTNSKRIFFNFYECFEIFLSTLNDNSNNQKLFNKYQFFFEFLQYGEQSLDIKETNIKRTEIFISYLRKFPNGDIITPLKNHFINNFKNVLTKIGPFLNENEIKKSNYFANEIDKICNIDEEASLLKDLESHIIEIKSFLRALMDTFSCFSSINSYDQEEISKKKNRKWLNNYLYYSNFKQIVNPYLLQENMNSIIVDICQINVNQLKNTFIVPEDLSFQNAVLAFVKCFMRLGCNFKIKIFFAEFLDELQIQFNKEKEQIKKIEKSKYIFLYLSYWFVINGFFNKRKGNTELFTKHYYNISNYFKK